MRNESDGECETCCSSGTLIGDKADPQGERTDDVQPCPDCAEAPENLDEPETLDFQRVERGLDLGGEA